MIEISTKIHDQYSIELKVGFVTRKQQRMNDFSLAMWMFVPRSLDITRTTYPKEMFSGREIEHQADNPDFPSARNSRWPCRATAEYSRSLRGHGLQPY